MPIIGLTDRASVIPRFPEIGRLHKGAAKSPNAPGRELHYFRFTSGISGVEDLFHRNYGDQPVALRVLLPYPSMEENLYTGVELWTGSRMLWRANGQRTIRRWMAKRGVYSDKDEDQIAMPNDPNAKSVSRLTVMLPWLIEAGFPGSVLLTSTSVYDAVNLTANILEGESRAIRAGANLTQMEFVLFRAMKMISTPDKKAKYPHWLCFLRPSEEWVKAQIAAARQAAYSLLPKGEIVTTPKIVSYTERVKNGEPQPTTILTSLPDGPGVDDELEPDDHADQTVAEVPPAETLPENFNSLYRRIVDGELPHFSKGKKPAAARKHVANFLKSHFEGKKVEAAEAWQALVEHDAEKRGIDLDDLDDKPPPLTENDDVLDVEGYEMASISGTEWADFWLGVVSHEIPMVDNGIGWVYLAKLASKLNFEKIDDSNAVDACRAICEYLGITPF